MVCMTAVLLFSNFLIGLYPGLKPALMGFHLTGFPYLEIYFINIYLFFCGMYFQRLSRSKYPNRELSADVSDYAIFWMLLLGSLSYLVLERFVSNVFPFIGSVVLLVMTSLFALRAQGSPTSVVSQALMFVGHHSLPIYLLHIPFYFFFARVGAIQMDSWPSFVISVLLLPLFLFVSLKLEQLSKQVSNGLLSL